MTSEWFNVCGAREMLWCGGGQLQVCDGSVDVYQVLPSVERGECVDMILVSAGVLVPVAHTRSKRVRLDTHVRKI